MPGTPLVRPRKRWPLAVKLHLRLRTMIGSLKWSGALILLLLDGLVKVRRRHRLQLRDLRLRLIVAKVELRRAAHRLQTLRELLERSEVAAALVVLQVVRGAVLDGGVPAHTGLVTKRLPTRRAVDVRNQRRGMPIELLGQLVPVRLHLLAVASPGRKELDEHSLPGRLRVPIGRRELLAGNRENKRQDQLHDEQPVKDPRASFP